MKKPKLPKRKTMGIKARQRMQDVIAKIDNDNAFRYGPSHPLPMCLSAAVPLWIAKFQTMPIEDVFDRKRLEEIQNVFMENGEAILYRTKAGKSAESFNALAEGIARMSFCPGGVTCFGMTFDSTYPMGIKP